MPKQKDLKRLVRARMEKTGESYAAARLQLLEKKRPSPSDADHAALAGVSDETVREKTGRTWREWVRVLDAIDAASKPHREIAAHVHEAHGIPGWWAQTVTVGYERIRGLRDVGQRRGGGYELTKSKTLPVPLARLYRAFSSPAARRRWLPGDRVTVKKATPGKSMRLLWEDGTPVEVYFTAKGDLKSQVALQHRALATKEDAAGMKAFWAERLASLAEAVAPKPPKR